MNTYIERSVYYALDWHDWKTTTSFLGDERDKYVISGDPVEAILRDVLDVFRVTDEKIKEIREKIVSHGLAVFEAVLFSNSNGTPEEPSEVFVRRLDDLHYRVDVETFVSYEINYEIKRIDERDVAYLPVRQYICFPKITPHADRTIHLYTESFELAQKRLKEFPAFMENQLFEDCKDIILIASRQEFDNNSWYRGQVELYKVFQTDEELFARTFHPMSDAHKYLLKKEQEKY